MFSAPSRRTRSIFDQPPRDAMNSTHSFFRGKVVLITGASSGIGKELAMQLARAGAKLTLAARRRDQLEAVAQTIASLSGTGTSVASCVVTCDVARDGDLERSIAETIRQFGRLDVVFANAGFGVVGGFKKLSIEDYRRQFETNIFGVLRTIYAALPELEKSRGNLAVIGSVSGWVATSGASPYCMSKFAVRALANSITPELRRAGVTLTLISPGFVVSDIRRVDNRGTLHPQAPDPVPAWIQMSTDKAVRQILHAVARGKKEQIVTFFGKLFVAFERFFPWLNRAIAARMVRVYDARSSL
jgi:short-subunit dehydrogenase